VHTLRNGDPGYPDEPPEVDFNHSIITKIIIGEDELNDKDIIAKIFPTAAETFFEKIDQESLIFDIIEKHSEYNGPDYEKE
jgi:hypothetical protein